MQPKTKTVDFITTHLCYAAAGHRRETVVHSSTKRLAAVAGLVFLSATIAWAKVIVDFDPAADFASYSNFAWIEQEGSVESQLPEHLRRRLRRVTEEVLATKGLEPSPAPPNTDLLLTYYFSVDRELRVEYVPYGLYTPYGYGYWGGYGYSYTQVRRYNKGTVVLDVVDARTHRLVWVGVIEQEIRSANPPGKKIEKAVTKLLKNFPPK